MSGELTKNKTITIPAIGSRKITIEMVDGVQKITSYIVTDTDGNRHEAAFTVAEVLAANPSIDAAAFAATLAAFRTYGDVTKLGFVVVP